MELSLINPEVVHTSSAAKALDIIGQLKQYSLLACDFEVATKYSKSQIDKWNELLTSNTLTKLQAVDIRSKLQATALDHPSHCTITHCSIAWSESESVVFVLDNKSITNVVLNYLITTEQTQVWHNASYDFSRIYYYTGKFPKVYEDSQILAKTLINDVDTFQARTGLKHLAGHMFGDWAISADNFTLEQIHDPKVIKYAGIDACATLWLWNHLQEESDRIDEYLRGRYGSV